MLLIALLLLSSSSFGEDSFPKENCVYEVAPTSSGDYINKLEGLGQTACSSLASASLDKRDHAYQSCCKQANTYVKKHAQPGSDNAKAQAVIEFPLYLCGKISGEGLEFSRAVCWNNTLDAIGYASTKQLAQDCLTKDFPYKQRLESAENLFGQPISMGEKIERGDEKDESCITKGLKDLKRNADIAGLNPPVDNPSTEELRSSRKTAPDQKGASEPGEASAQVPLVNPARSGF